MTEGLKIVAYLRVSTGRQGKSGLGLQAQREIIKTLADRYRFRILSEHIEVESAKRDDNRPKLREALIECQRTGATLVVAKLDRLSRDLAFIANLMKTKVQFLAADFPEGNALTLHIRGAFAEYERTLISERTRNALQAAKVRRKEQGLKPLGNPQNLTDAARAKGRVEAAKSICSKADEYASRIAPIIREIQQQQGISLHAIARKLSADGELTPRGSTTWTGTTVRNVLKRIEG
jgi:DNA invertase Pin-like site-specific DNA recombinase